MSNIVSGIAQKKQIGSSTKKSVFMFLASCASDNGAGIWVSKQNIANDLEMSKRTVQVSIKSFVDSGLIFEVGRRHCRNGYTVEYSINIDVLSALESTRAAGAPVQQMHPTRAAGAPQDVQQVHPNSTITTIEPPLFISPKSARQKTRLTQMPEDAVISEEHIMIAAEAGHGSIEAEAQFKLFKNGALAKARRYANWNAAWRNWFNSPYFRIQTGGHNSGKQHHNPTKTTAMDQDPALEQLARLSKLR